MFGVQRFRGLLWHTPQGAKRIMNLHDVGFDWNRFKHACSVDTCTKRTRNYILWWPILVWGGGIRQPWVGLWQFRTWDNVLIWALSRGA